jgi:hypothetical protein
VADADLAARPSQGAARRSGGLCAQGRSP